ncbi:unnamed protein product [Effrenium voratum]|uniref:Palmitoyltransferase n=1 Tax=Effrenium voratum TaxID=2562239 RepID=A0AA36NHX1_9DINO|nr:unnamed protein product [Effrenium voratum]
MQSGTHGFVLTTLPRLLAAPLSVELWWTFFVLIYAEAAIAVVCLLYLLFGDPGVIKRSPETCFPLPQEVATRLRRGEALEGVENIQEGDSTFCVRCLVWRPTKQRSWLAEAAGGKMPPWLRRCLPCLRDGRCHHCRTCGRCVRFFDHHCGVFGRCIAGTLVSGNMPFFCTIIFMAFAGFSTMAISLVAALVELGRANHGLLHGLGATTP